MEHCFWSPENISDSEVSGLIEARLTRFDSVDREGHSLRSRLIQTLRRNQVFGKYMAFPVADIINLVIV